MKSLIGLSRSLFIDLKRLHPECKGLERDLQTIEARFEEEGDGFLSVALPDLGKAFDQGLARGRMPACRSFGRQGAIPRFLRGMLSHIFDTKTGFLLKEPSVEYILSVRQVLYFFKKFLPSDDRTQVLHRRTVGDFVETDSRCLDPHPVYSSRLAVVADMVLLELDEFQELKGRHGPGAVAEGYSANQKWRALWSGLVGYDPRLLSLGYDFPILGLNAMRVESDSNVLTSNVARLVTVPKSCSALRTITVEPCLNQFVQHGLNRHLRDNIQRCPILKRSLSLSSQVPNQILALAGSLSGEWATVDLSSASDLLSVKTVRMAFINRPRFLTAVLGCRTPEVDLGKTTISLKKFAGMGNALTFPVQSVIFALLAICAQHKRWPCRPTYRELRHYASLVRVFGDDIIVPRDSMMELGRWMSEFGLKINRTKTFFEGNFRESCGVDAYRGVDVTPCYLRVDPVISSNEPSQVASCISTSNQLWLRCYYEAAEYLRRQVDRRKRLPLVRLDSSGLGWHTRQNVQEYGRWSNSLHRFEVKTWVQIPKRRSDVLDGEPGVLKFFHSPRIGEDDPDHSMTSVRRFSTKLCTRWCP